MDAITVGDVMKHSPLIISPEKTAKDAAKLMKDIDCGVLPVGTHPEKIVGIITDRDITLRLTAEGKDASKTPIKEVMTRKVYSCTTDMTIEDAAELMREHYVCRLLVMHEGHVTGIVNLTDLLRNNYKIESCDKVFHQLLGLRTKHRAKALKSA